MVRGASPGARTPGGHGVPQPGEGVPGGDRDSRADRLASARVYLANGDLDQAAPHAAEAVRIATDTHSARNRTIAFAAQSAITTRRQGL
ncbi:hypothetical protein ACFYPK_28180 [Streptomyces halstedii]|uniref:hypothetical protein n=1 Tax=Streptomyces halstedii TaxID=1944 RepID=UPI0036C31E3C